MDERKGIGWYGICIDRKPDRVRFRDVPCSLPVGVYRSIEYAIPIEQRYFKSGRKACFFLLGGAWQSAEVKQ